LVPPGFIGCWFGSVVLGVPAGLRLGSSLVAAAGLVIVRRLRAAGLGVVLRAGVLRLLVAAVGFRLGVGLLLARVPALLTHRILGGVRVGLLVRLRLLLLLPGRRVRVPRLGVELLLLLLVVRGLVLLPLAGVLVELLLLIGGRLRPREKHPLNFRLADVRAGGDRAVVHGLDPVFDDGAFLQRDRLTGLVLQFRQLDRVLVAHAGGEGIVLLAAESLAALVRLAGEHHRLLAGDSQPQGDRVDAEVVPGGGVDFEQAVGGLLDFLFGRLGDLDPRGLVLDDADGVQRRVHVLLTSSGGEE
jgi:hypothetical protein